MPRAARRLRLGFAAGRRPGWQPGLGRAVRCRVGQPKASQSQRQKPHRHRREAGRAGKADSADSGLASFEVCVSTRPYALRVRPSPSPPLSPRYPLPPSPTFDIRARARAESRRRTPTDHGRTRVEGFPEPDGVACRYTTSDASWISRIYTKIATAARGRSCKGCSERGSGRPHSITALEMVA